MENKRGNLNKPNRFRDSKVLLMMLTLPILWYIIFHYIPMGGAVLAFKEYRYDMGILKSPWVGFDHFKYMFKDKQFIQALKNTLIFALGKLIIHFPVPIIIAILLNEVPSKGGRRFFQTVFTFPHFISWVVLASIFTHLFAGNGVVNQIILKFGGNEVSPLISTTAFRPFIWFSNLWKEFGWDSIIYLSALTSIDPSLYEAAEVDGANRFQKMRYITLPGIKNIIAIMFILEIGNVMGSASFNQIFNLYSPTVYPVGDILDTYVQRYTFEMGANFGYTTAVGLFKSIIGVTMITMSNKLVTWMGEDGLF